MRLRSFLCLCFRIFLRRFLTTLAIHTPFLRHQGTDGCSPEYLPTKESGYPRRERFQK